MSTNWRAMQVPRDKTTKQALRPVGILPKYMTMGTFHADMSRDGRSRKIYKGAGTKMGGKE